MRLGLFIALAVLLVAPVSVRAANPPVVFQMQPIGRVLNDVHTVARLLHGEEAVKEINKEITEKLGAKGFDGLDLEQPISGYLTIPTDPTETTVVIVVPVVGEKEFLDFLERLGKTKPKSLGKGLYEIPGQGNGDTSAYVRVVDGSGYLAFGDIGRKAALDPKALVPASKLIDSGERSHLSCRVYFDRIPKEVRDKLTTLFADSKKKLSKLVLPEEFGDWAKKSIDELIGLGSRYLDLLPDAKDAGFRVTLNATTGELITELALSGKPGSPLATAIAARKPSTNQFAELITKDTAAGMKLQLPLFTPEIQKAAVYGLEEGQKLASGEVPPAFKAASDEAFKGLIRTIKTGQFDIAGAMRGPNKDGSFVFIGAFSFEDTSALEKEIKTLIEKEVPEQFKAFIKLDSDKAGKVNIHEVKLSGVPELPDEFKQIFGNKSTLAFAFAPKGIFVAAGPNAVGVLKDSLSIKPGLSPVFDLLVNAARLTKLIAAGGGEDDGLIEALGNKDELVSTTSITVEGGKELKVRIGASMRSFPRGKAAAPADPR